MPRHVDDLAECAFYHCMEIPGYGAVEGDWDLRLGLDAYLGGVGVAGRRVLEMGTADGYLAFAMEARGAEVVGHDLSPQDRWDVVPFARGQAVTSPSWVTSGEGRSPAMRRLNNAWWLSHRAFGSRARLVTGTVYDVPAGIGPVDVSVFGALLLHTRDPFGALASALRLTRRTVVVTDALGLVHLPAPLRSVRARLPRQLRRPLMRFMPDWNHARDADGWWRLTPEIVAAFVGVLGFERSRISTHRQLYRGRPKRMFTVVATRTAGAVADDVASDGLAGPA